MFKLDLEKAEKPEIKLPTCAGSSKKHDSSRKKKKNIYLYIYFCFIDYTKALDCGQLWTILKQMVILDHLTCLLRNRYAGQEATVRTGVKTDWFQVRNKYVKTVYCHHAYLTYMQSTS